MKYVCTVCGHVYDEEAEKVPFSSLPPQWTCPRCGAEKAMFDPLEEKKERGNDGSTNESPEQGQGKTKLSAGALAAVFSNLARGCEKQYKAEEAELFAKIAAFYTSLSDDDDTDASPESLAALAQEDISSTYPAARKTAENKMDRGALRICTWGEKVTRIARSLLSQYRKGGEELLRESEVWLCTVCGFVYIGRKPPELCPVCKVPSWKFTNVEGGEM